MPLLDWDETDVLTCLEVIPETDEFGSYYHYQVQRQDLGLNVEILPHESFTSVNLLHRSQEIANWYLILRGPICRVIDRAGERLRFYDCILMPDRIAHLDGPHPFDATLYPISVTMELRIKPHIRVEFRRGDGVCWPS